MAQPPAPLLQGPPYPPTVAGLGGTPAVLPDVPVSAVFMALFVCTAVINMTILIRNRRRGHKFMISMGMFMFSVARVATLAVRVAWAADPRNAHLALAGTILVNAGVLVLYIINFLLAQRILRARRPSIGWHPALRVGFRAVYVLMAAALVMVIIATVVGAYSLNPHTRQVCRALQLTAATYFLLVAVLPVILLVVAALAPLHKGDMVETFGTGSMRAKAAVVAVTTTYCSVIAGFRAGAAWARPRSLSNPAWFHSKPAFYVFLFAFEIITLAILTSSRIDRLFHIPNGSKGPGDYTYGTSGAAGGDGQGDGAAKKG